MAKRRRGKKIARETAMAIVMLVIIVFIAGTFIYADKFDSQKIVLNSEDAAVGHVVVQVVAAQNSTNLQAGGSPAGEQTKDETP